MAGRDGGDRAAIADALPGYDVSGVLGEGAMGVVLGGRHRKLDRAVAIKQLPPAVAEDAEARERFGHEARVLASLTHPHIVPVFDYVEREGLCLLVMEALPGGSVWDRFTAEGLTPTTTCAVAVATCAGLQHAHDQQVLHRDIKPENLLFAADQTLKVTDFGIAEVLGGEETLATAEGGVVGTPAYMAPEQAEGSHLGPTADVYAAGTLLYELLSGRLPFEADDPVALLERRLTTDPRPLQEVAPHVPASLCTVVMQALERDPGRRQPSARALGSEVVGAANEAWGPDWLERSTVNVLTPIAPSTPTRTPEPEAEPTVAPEGTADDRGTRVAGSTETSDREVRPTLTSGRVRVEGTSIVELQRDDLVSVKDILTPPPPPWRMLAAFAAAAVVLVLVLVTGLSVPSHDAAEGHIVLGGTDLSSGEAPTIDFGEDIPLRVPRELARAATEAELELQVGGIGVGGSGREDLHRRAGALTTTFSVGTLQHLTAGEMTGELHLYGPRGQEVLAQETGIVPDSSPWLTLTTIIGLIAALGTAAYAVSLSSPLRAGRRRRAALTALPVVGAVGGAAGAILGWSVQVGPELTIPTLVVAMGLGALTGALLGPIALRFGRRKRLRAAT
jgi:serine/threonine-protein kinase